MTAHAGTAFRETPGIGHNGGPPLDPSVDWRRFCWRQAHARAWKTPSREIALPRLARARVARHDLSAIHLGVVGSGRPSVRKAPARAEPFSRRSVKSAGLRQILRDEVPIHQMVQESLHKIRAAVLEVEIIGMLPHVAGEERRLAFGQRIDRVWRGGDLELAAIGDKPCPAAAELTDRRGLELLFELIEAAESRSIAWATCPLGEPPPLGFISSRRRCGSTPGPRC